MPITPTYPGIYIQELQSSTHTIVAAPTSIAVFIGYSHPFKTTANWGEAVQIFSFTDYERAFGGFFSNAVFDSDTAGFGSLAHAVSQFFLNGGATAYVIGLQAGAIPLTASTITVGGVGFTLRELIDSNHQMKIVVTPATGSTTIADVTITYGPSTAMPGIPARAEIYRNVSSVSTAANYIGSVIGTISNFISSLVYISTPPASSSFTSDTQTVTTANPGSSSDLFNSGSAFASVFQSDSSLDNLPIFNLMIIPGVTSTGVLAEAIAFCEQKRAFLILDPTPDQTPVQMVSYTIPASINAALYYPYINSTNPSTGAAVAVPPSGTVAGIYARTDTNRGVWKAPAGLETTLTNVTGVVATGQMNDMRQGTLNPIGVDCLRTFPGIGTVVFGARTSVAANPSFQQWWYVPVRRMTLFIEQTLYNNLKWVIFEPNAEPLWVAIRTSIENFMLSLFQQGAFQGTQPSQAFQVKCDSTTTTQNDIDQGIVNIIVAFAPLKPAEFVIVKIAQLAGQAQS